MADRSTEPLSAIGTPGYREGMTSQGGSEGEPTLADVLAALQGIAAAQHAQGGALDALDEKVDAGFFAVGARFDMVDARHLEVTQALEAIAGMAHAHQAQLARVEARLESRIEDVQRVVQALKGDIAAHLADPDAHGHAA